MRFVYPYVRSNTRELEISARSILRAYPDARLWAIGDNPSLDCVSWIGQKRKPNPFEDTLAKLKRALELDELGDSFFWIHDDVFLCRAAELDDLKAPRAQAQLTADFVKTWRASNTWLVLKRATFQDLVERGLPLFDYASHLPTYVEKPKLRALFDEYPLEPMRLWEIYYGNRFHNAASVDLANWFWRWLGPQRPEAFSRLERVTWANCNASGWTPTAERALCAWLGLETSARDARPARRSQVLTLTRGRRP
jgi:hypothetical protein